MQACKFYNLLKRDQTEKPYHLPASKTYCSDSPSKSVKWIRIKGYTCNNLSIQRFVYQSTPALNTVSSKK